MVGQQRVEPGRARVAIAGHEHGPQPPAHGDDVADVAGRQHDVVLAERLEHLGAPCGELGVGDVGRRGVDGVDQRDGAGGGHIAVAV